MSTIRDETRDMSDRDLLLSLYSSQREAEAKFDELFRRMLAIEELGAAFVEFKHDAPMLAALVHKEMQDEIRVSDDQVFEEIKKINDRLAIFDLSVCSVRWLWDNKKMVTTVMMFVSLWFYGVDVIARWSQWTFFPPGVGP